MFLKVFLLLSWPPVARFGISFVGKNPQRRVCSSLWVNHLCAFGDPFMSLDICFLISERGLIILMVPPL